MQFQKLVGKGPSSNISLAAAKTLWVWGKNQYGQLGMGDTVYRSSPVQVPGSTNWISVSGGLSFRLGVKGDGTLWSWGNNFFGELGLRDTIKRSSPTQIGTLALWSKAAAADYERAGFAIRTDGTLWSWGYAGYGALGNNQNLISSPVQVGTLANWANVNFGRSTAIAVKTDGTLWTWGRNQHGQFGIGNTTNNGSPVQVGTLAGWAGAFMTFSTAVATKTDGTLWSWGHNGDGSVGDGTVVYRSSPVQIGTLTTWSQVTGTLQAGTPGGSLFARKTDGTIWAWGPNIGRQLGLGDNISRSSPTQIGTLATWSSVASGYTKETTAIMTNGTLWAWGPNTSGSLGTGDAVQRSVPAQVGTLTGWISCGNQQSSDGGQGFRLA